MIWTWTPHAHTRPSRAKTVTLGRALCELLLIIKIQMLFLLFFLNADTIINAFKMHKNMVCYLHECHLKALLCFQSVQCAEWQDEKVFQGLPE